MKSKKLQQVYSASLIISGLISFVIALSTIFQIELPDVLRRSLGVIDLAALFLLAFSWVKMKK